MFLFFQICSSRLASWRDLKCEVSLFQPPRFGKSHINLQPSYNIYIIYVFNMVFLRDVLAKFSRNGEKRHLSWWIMIVPKYPGSLLLTCHCACMMRMMHCGISGFTWSTILLLLKSFPCLSRLGNLWRSTMLGNKQTCNKHDGKNRFHEMCAEKSFAEAEMRMRSFRDTKF